MTTDQNSSRPPIAIIGASALFPGSVDATGFWRDILAGKDLLSDVPPSHWLIEDYYDPNPAAPDKTYAKRGAFLKDVPFDPMGFGVPPSTVPATDTAQLLALIVAQKVLEDASNGDLGRIDRSRTSVILGVTSAQELLASMVGRLQRPVWVKALRESGIPESEVQAICDRISSNYVPWQEATFPGLLGNVVAGRIANRLDLGGTNCVTDAACASTFSAISMGINELYLGQSDLVISGGVDTMNDIFMYMCFSKTPALSPTGDCRPFSDQADGTMLGEGIGMVALKRLADAERDGDRVYAVLRGLGSSSDGKAKSVYAPLPQGQARALSRAYEIAGYSPRSVELMEAHGTGTKAGDAAEFEGLSSIFRQSQEAGPWCALGSVKSQIGHTKAAAGAAGLFKTVMALHHKVLPPTIKVDRPNPKLNLDSSPFYLNTKTRPWVRGEDHPRRASVSSFGFGGSNFHLALEEYQGPNQAPRLLARSHELVVLSAATAAELSAQAQTRAEEAKRPGALAWLAHATQHSFSASAAHRLAVVADSDTDLAAKLSDAAKRISAGAFALPGVYYAAGAALGPVAFLFPGQGSQSIGMGAELLQHFSVALEPWDHAADRGLHDVVYPRPGWGEAAEREQAAKLVRTEIAQPALGCMSASMLRLMRALKVEAQALAGHSFGEVSALYAAGAISEDDFLAVAEKRGQLMAEASAIPGAMTAVTTSKERIDALLKELGLPVVIANHNDPNQVVLSGPTDAVEKVEKACGERKISARRLNVATAFHSPVVAASSAPFGAFLEKLAVSAPTLPVYANGTALPYPKDPGQIRRQLAGQIAEPVRFVEQIEAMYAAGIRVFVEVGAGTVLTNFVARILDGRPHAAIALDDKRGGVLGLMLALGKLVSAGAPVDFGALWAEHRLPENPAGRTAPALTLDINGSNYQRPYPPKGGASALPSPNPPRAEPEPQIVERIVERIVEVPVAAAPSNGHLAPSNGHVAPSNGYVAPSQAYAAPSDDWLRIFEETQRRTADAHSTYQRTMADSHTAFLAAMGAGLDQLAGTSQPAAMRPMPMEQARPVAALPMAMAPRATPLPAPAPMAVAPTMAAPAPAAVAKPAAPAAKPKAPSPAAPSHNLGALLFDVVSEKTGYPAAMLKAEMDLEGDLGIDSIKRVEILSAMRERAPGLPEVEADKMAKLRTLGEILGHLSDGAPAQLSAAVSAPATKAPAARGPDLGALLFEVVADKTGYPAAMLKAEMDLEGDLGIDSIKRVEILSAMRERAPGLPEVEADKMAKLRTLGEILGHLGGAPGKAEAPRAAAKAESKTSALGRWIVEPVEVPALRLAQPSLYRAKRIVVSDDGTGVAPALIEALGKRGLKAELESQEAAGEVFIHLGGLKPLAGPADAMAIEREALFSAQRFGRRQPKDGAFILVLDAGGDLGAGGASGDRAYLGGLFGLAKTAALEWPSCHVRAIDLERGGRSASQLADALLEELLYGGPEVEVGLSREGRRVTLRSRLAPPSSAKPIVDANSVIVVSGGARGVTAGAVIALAKAHRGRYALLGRTPLSEEPASCRGKSEREVMAALAQEMAGATPKALRSKADQVLANREIRATLRAIEAAGGEARYVPVDVQSAPQVAQALAPLRASWGPITGLIHAAGVIEDRRIVDKTEAQVDRVLGTKVDGLGALLAATAADPLKLICLYSSISGRTGNIGQSDYAMGNEILNKVARALAHQRPGCLVKSIGWGPWKGGMVTPAHEEVFKAQGVPLIPLEEGANMLVAELSSPEGVEVVLGASPVMKELVVNLLVSRGTHAYLEGHAIKGTPVVPVVLVLEWFVRAARSFAPSLSLVRITDLKVVRGVRLEHFEDGGHALAVRVRQISNGTGMTVRLELLGSGGELHYSADAQLAPVQEPPAARPADPQVSAWGEQPIYGGVLFHGPKFQVIQAMDGVSDEGGAASLSGVNDQGWPTQGWRTDCAAMDGGLQLALLWSKQVLGCASLPTAIGAVRVYSDGPAVGPIRCVLLGRERQKERAISDVYFMGADGALLAELKGVETHALPGKS